MTNLTCIICPIGCSLEVDESVFSVMGNKCKHGAEYALEEIRCPKRIVTATAAIKADQIDKNFSVRRIPVKTALPCPRKYIPALLREIYKLKVSLPVKAGDVLIAGWSPAGNDSEKIDVAATRTIVRHQS